MKKTLQKRHLWLMILGAFLIASISVEASKPAIIGKMATRPVAKIQKRSVVPFKLTQKPKLRSAKSVSGAAYNYPGVLPYDGYANYISFNIVNNDYSVPGKEDYLFFPKDSATTYVDASTNNASTYSWSAPGATPATAETQDLDVVYGQEGRFDFPTLTAGAESYTATGSIKVGGKAEICSFNSFMLDSTYIPTYYEFQDNVGFITGSNTYEDKGFANLMFVGQDSATIESVSVYIRPNPTAADPTNKVKLVIYEPGDDNSGNFKLDNKILATSELTIAQMMSGASSVTGITYASGQEVMGMANFKFPAPVKVGSYFFVSVENFGNNLANGDSLCIMMNDLDPIPADSFASYGTNTSWSYSTFDGTTYEWYPLQDIIWGGALNPVLMICPIVNYNNKLSDISRTTTKPKAILTRNNNGFCIIGAEEGELVNVYRSNGMKVISSIIKDVRQNFTLTNPGVYFVIIGKSTYKVVI